MNLCFRWICNIRFVRYSYWYLLLVPSARHFSELHALSVELPMLIESPKSFNLTVIVAFLLQTIAEAALPAGIFVEGLLP